MIIYFPVTSKQGFHFRQTTFDGKKAATKSTGWDKSRKLTCHTFLASADRRKPEEMETEEADFYRKEVRTQW
jgi:hypothetical protein